MNDHSKVTADHLRRDAYLYVRRSSLYQVALEGVLEPLVQLLLSSTPRCSVTVPTLSCRPPLALLTTLLLPA